MKVSVLIPTYNVSEWIEESLFSIINQTHRDLEIIVVDDCSTDDTFAKIEKIAAQDARLIIRRNKKNLKITKTLNEALILATGAFIARVDGDDVAEPDRIEKQLSLLQEKHLDLVGCQMLPIDENGKVIGHPSSLPVGIDLINRVKIWSSPITHIWLARAEVYKALQGYREVPYAEDYDFVMRAIDKGFKCDNHPEALMRIRHRSGNTASVASLLQRKAHNYVIKLHRERLAVGHDSFSESAVVPAGAFITACHQHSTQFLRKAYLSRNIAAKAVLTGLACVLSLYNTQYLYGRYRVKKIMDKL